MRGLFIKTAIKALDKVEDMGTEVGKKRLYALLDKMEAVHKKVAAEASGVADALRVGASRKDRAAFASVARWLELIDREQKPFTQKVPIVEPDAILDTYGALARLKQINAANPDPRAVEALAQLILSFRKTSTHLLGALPEIHREVQTQLAQLELAKFGRRMSRDLGL